MLTPRTSNDRRLATEVPWTVAYSHAETVGCLHPGEVAGVATRLVPTASGAPDLRACIATALAACDACWQGCTVPPDLKTPPITTQEDSP